MVRHHAPADQRITLPVKTQQGLLNEFSDCRVGQGSATMSLVQRDVGRLDAMFPRRAGETLSDMSREAVSDPERDVLKQIRRIQMRQIATRTPAGMVAICHLR